MNAEQNGLLTTAEFRDFAKIGRTKLYEEIRTGRLRARKAGRKTLIAVQDALAWKEALPTMHGNQEAH